jgi:hypothetical protein
MPSTVRWKGVRAGQNVLGGGIKSPFKYITPNSNKDAATEMTFCSSSSSSRRAKRKKKANTFFNNARQSRKMFQDVPPFLLPSLHTFGSYKKQVYGTPTRLQTTYRTVVVEDGR